MTICIPCGRGFHNECTKGCKKCHGKKETEQVRDVQNHTEPGVRKKGSTAATLKDALSTGRKRAAELYPLNKNEACEWRGKRNCGGGRRPIVGCVDGFQVARHHGPVKDTTKNHEGNVHRICTRCHNHWHELNDLIYDEREFALLPSDPQEATVEELVNDEMAWRSGDMGRKYELASSQKGKLDLTKLD